MREAELWEREDGRVHCRVCPNDCRIAPGGRGVCGVREERDGILVPLTYARVSSVAADPIEKKPVYHYRPGTAVFSLGSVGCSMRCGQCQNWQISRDRPGGGVALQTLEPDAAVALAREHGCAGIAFTYNEPVIWIEYVLDTASAAKDAGLYTVMVTNGYITPEALDLIGPVIDVWRVDVKAFDDDTYRSLCHVRSVRPVLEAAVRAQRRWGMHVEVVTNVIPTVNDDDDTLRGIAEWIASALGPATPWHLTRFFPYLELAHLQPTPLDTLRRARSLGVRAGLRHVYLGNTREPEGSDTVCPRCGAVVIERDGYAVEPLGLRGDACEACGERLGIVSEEV